MTDPREALVDWERVAYGEAWDALVPEVGRTVGQIVTSTIDAILAAGWTPPSVKPSVEDVRDEIAGYPIGYGYYSTEVGVEEAAEIADAVLALFPGRTEAEVKAEALREAAVDVIQDDQGTDEWYAGWLRDRAARIEGGGDRG